jgi:hypothetical protein
MLPGYNVLAFFLGEWRLATTRDACMNNGRHNKDAINTVTTRVSFMTSKEFKTGMVRKKRT